jgi:hypothetical protein
MPGTVTLSFSYIGYRSQVETLNIREGEDLVLNVAMEPGVLSLEQVVVSADRMEQKRSDLTVTMDVIKSEYLYRTHITDAQELITKTPGIEVLDGQASIRGGSGFSYGVGSGSCTRGRVADDVCRCGKHQVASFFRSRTWRRLRYLKVLHQFCTALRS